MISKELLSEVLDRKVVEFIEESWLCSSNTIVYILEDDVNEDFINIYELAHKCKEWAYSKGYVIVSMNNFKWCYVNVSNLGGLTLKEVNSDTEPQAIFKACEWILKNLKKQEE